MTTKHWAVATLALAGLAGSGHAQQVTVFASGLQNPAKVILAGRGALLVAETGSSLNSGRISVIDAGGRVQPLMDGLPSGPAAPDGTLDGPSGLALDGNVLFILNGEGNTHVAAQAPGTIVPNPAGRSSPIYSSILKVALSRGADQIREPFVLSRADHDTLADGNPVELTNGAGDKAVIELLADFRDNVPDARMIYRNSHPYGMTLHPSYPGWLFVADAGMNTVWKVEIATGRARTLVRFPNIATGIPGRPFAEAVPTSVQPYGNQLLVTQLSGVPFVPGTARVSIVDPATGATGPFIPWGSTAMDIAWEERPGASRPTFYLLEFSAALGQTPPAPGRIRRWTNLQEDLFVPALRTPTSMALDSAARALYVTNRSEGTILKVSLP
ncbi:MAG: hypothetical protein KatS3mg005_2152 [Bryobacteraceae bacterium]|nr:MAG: hypothetical protein KatS3mg005_2152 [Bryobacteraceae bacterium]